MFNILAMMGVMFIGLKITNSIDWSWWAVLLPFYGTVIVAFIYVTLFQE